MTSTSILVLLLSQLGAVICAPVRGAGDSQSDAGPSVSAASLPTTDLNRNHDPDTMADLPLWISSYAPVPDLVQEIDALCTRVESNEGLRPARDTELVLLYDRIRALRLRKRAIDALIKRCECLAPQAAQRFLQLKRSIVIPYFSSGIHGPYQLHMTPTALATIRKMGVRLAHRRICCLPHMCLCKAHKQLPTVMESKLICAFVQSGKSELLFDPETLLTLLDVGIRFHAVLVLYQAAVPPTCDLMDVLPLFRTLWTNALDDDPNFPGDLLFQAQLLRRRLSQTSTARFWAMPVRDFFVGDLTGFSQRLTGYVDANRVALLSDTKRDEVPYASLGADLILLDRAVSDLNFDQDDSEDETSDDDDGDDDYDDNEDETSDDDVDDDDKDEDMDVSSDSDGLDTRFLSDDGDDSDNDVILMSDSESDSNEETSVHGTDCHDDNAAGMLKSAGFPFYRDGADPSAVAALYPALRRALKQRNVL